jgi:hypothetical protein
MLTYGKGRTWWKEPIIGEWGRATIIFSLYLYLSENLKQYYAKIKALKNKN